MGKSIHFRIDLAMALIAFVGMVLGVVAVTGHILWPWPVTAVRLIVNGLTTLVIAWKVVEYLRGDFPANDNEAIGGLTVGVIISLGVIIALFVTQHMGALSTLYLIAFCIMGYIDTLSARRDTEASHLQEQVNQQEETQVITIEQEKGL